MSLLAGLCRSTIPWIALIASCSPDSVGSSSGATYTGRSATGSAGIASEACVPGASADCVCASGVARGTRLCTASDPRMPRVGRFGECSPCTVPAGVGSISTEGAGRGSARPADSAGEPGGRTDSRGARGSGEAGASGGAAAGDAGASVGGSETAGGGPVSAAGASGSASSAGRGGSGRASSAGRGGRGGSGGRGATRQRCDCNRLCPAIGEVACCAPDGDCICGRPSTGECTR